MLVSVGGLQNQDLPMSGTLQETRYLGTSPHLRALLSCFIPKLGRVYLIYLPIPETVERSQLYQNSAHSLFYQTVSYQVGAEYYLLVETRSEDSGTTEKPLFDSARLHNLIGKISVPDEPLKLTTPQLDVLTPEYIRYYLTTILTHCRPSLNEPEWRTLNAHGEQFLARWQALYAQFGNNYAGEWSYLSALNYFHEVFAPEAYAAFTDMQITARQAAEQALELITSQLTLFPPAPQRINRKLLLKARRRKQLLVEDLSVVPQFERPVFIVSVPRAGSTLLFETLSQFRGIWSTGEENHALLEDIAGLHPRDHNFHSNRLDANDANDTIRTMLLKAFTSKLQNSEQQYYLDLPLNERHGGNIRFLEKTPKNALRIPFIKALFPDALFIYLHRDFNSNVSSLIDGWRSQRFIAYRNLPGFENRHWSFLLIPGWRELHNRSIAEIASHQWETGNRIIQNDLNQLPKPDWMRIDYHDLITQPQQLLRGFAQFANLEWDDAIQARCENGLPVSRLTLTSPQNNKWRKHQRLVYFPDRENTKA